MSERCKEIGRVFISGEAVASVRCGCGEGHSIAGHYGALVVVIDGQENNLSVMWGGAKPIDEVFSKRPEKRDL